MNKTGQNNRIQFRIFWTAFLNALAKIVKLLFYKNGSGDKNEIYRG
jgi:hypothetical protein